MNNLYINNLYKITIGVLLFLLSFAALAQPIQIVAAENFYGDLARKIGGPYVSVTNILNNPNQDPHLFSSTTAIAKTIAHADIVIYNGIGYDPWMTKLLSANRRQPKIILIIANLMHRKAGDNPHIWYDPKTMPAYVNVLADKLAQLDPTHANYFHQQAIAFNDEFKPINQLIEEIRAHHFNTPIIATEPVFNDMAAALTFKVYGKNFQLSIMNDTEPSIADIRDFEDKLKQHQVKVLIYNNQVVNPLTGYLKKLAENAHIPVVGVSETQPFHSSYIEWMVSQLITLKRALN